MNKVMQIASGVIVTFYAFLSSCTDDFSPILMDEDLGQQACVELCVIDTTEVLGIDDVLKAAVNFSSTAALESRTVPYPVSDVEVICNSKGDTTLYVVNFGEDNGFIVLSASNNSSLIFE